MFDDPEGRLSPWRTITDSGTAYATMRPGIALRIWAVVGGEIVERFAGIVDSIDDSFPDPGTARHEVVVTAFDYSSLLAAYDGLEESPQGAGETAGPRLTRIATNADYAYPVAFDAGDVELQATTLAKNALDEAGMVADTELGALFCEPDGTLRFRDRNGLVTDPLYTDVQATFGEVEPEICYSSIASRSTSTRPGTSSRSRRTAGARSRSRISTPSRCTDRAPTDAST